MYNWLYWVGYTFFSFIVKYTISYKKLGFQKSSKMLKVGEVDISICKDETEYPMSRAGTDPETAIPSLLRSIVIVSISKSWQDARSKSCREVWRTTYREPCRETRRRVYRHNPQILSKRCSEISKQHTKRSSNHFISIGSDSNHTREIRATQSRL